MVVAVIKNVQDENQRARRGGEGWARKKPSVPMNPAAVSPYAKAKPTAQ
jgi:hypothetical protein